MIWRGFDPYYCPQWNALAKTMMECKGVKILRNIKSMECSKSFDEFKVRMLDLTMNVVAPLAPQLEMLGDGIGRVIEAAGNSELLKEGLKTASEYLDRFAKYIGDPQAKKDFEEFVSSVEEMTGGINETVLKIKALSAAIQAVVDFFPNVGRDIGQALPVPAGHGTADALRNMLGIEPDVSDKGDGRGGYEGGEEKKGFFGRAWDWMTGGDSDDLVTKLHNQQGAVKSKQILKFEDNDYKTTQKTKGDYNVNNFIYCL
jgi:hypothetical protein